MESFPLAFTECGAVWHVGPWAKGASRFLVSAAMLSVRRKAREVGMDLTLRVAVIGAVGVISTAALSSVTSIWVAREQLQSKTHEIEAANRQAQINLNKTAGLLRHVYDNGTLTSTSATGGRMVVRVNGSRSGGPVSTQIDMNRFIELCGDEDGCSITLGATRFHMENQPTYVIDAPLHGASCRFFWDKATRTWTLSTQCVAIFGTYKYDNALSKYIFDSVLQMNNYSNMFGHDDSDDGTRDGDGQPLVVTGFRGACYLAESAPDVVKGNGHFMADNPNDPSTGKGLFLIASSPTWDYPGAYPHDAKGNDTIWPSNDPARRCELIVED